MSDLAIDQIVDWEKIAKDLARARLHFVFRVPRGDSATIWVHTKSDGWYPFPTWREAAKLLRALSKPGERPRFW